MTHRKKDCPMNTGWKTIAGLVAVGAVSTLGVEAIYLLVTR